MHLELDHDPVLAIALLLAGVAAAAVAGQPIRVRSRRGMAGPPAGTGASATTADRA